MSKNLKKQILLVILVIIGLVHADEDISENTDSSSDGSNVVINVDANSDIANMFTGDDGLGACAFTNPNGAIRYIQFSNAAATVFTSWVFVYRSNTNCTGSTRQTRTFTNGGGFSTPAGTHIPCDINNNAFRQTSGTAAQSVQVTWNWSGGSNSICYNSRTFTASPSGTCTSANCSFNAGTTSVFAVK